MFATMREASPHRTVAFLTGTRADFGKLKPLIQVTRDLEGFDYQICATGMHLLARYGQTVNEIVKAGFENVFQFYNQDGSGYATMESALASTLTTMSHFLRERRPDLLVVHGDRVETLAGAIAGALNNTLVCHIEGGERSGTIDEFLRHAVTKMSHLHLVANEEAASRLRSMGELASTIRVIGSPDIDVMLANDLPSLDEVLKRYEIPFREYGILLYHPVTTDVNELPARASALVDAVESCGRRFVVIAPNNDHGAEFVEHELRRLGDESRFRHLPSLRFEAFLTLLRYSERIVGNSSAGIREAPVYGVQTINVGNRQSARFEHESILDFDERSPELRDVLSAGPVRYVPTSHFGDGRSAAGFREFLLADDTWSTARQKRFVDRFDSR